MRCWRRPAPGGWGSAMQVFVPRVVGLILHELLAAPGCPVRGLHVTDAETADCEACVRSTTPSDEPVELVFDPVHRERQSIFRIDTPDLTVPREQMRVSWLPGVGPHRQDGPAVVWGEVELWCSDGLVHRDGAPALVMWDYEVWFERGRVHRIDGPAVLCDWDRRWVHHGEQIDEHKAWIRFLWERAGVVPDNYGAHRLVGAHPDYTSEGTFRQPDPKRVAAMLRVSPNLGDHEPRTEEVVDPQPREVDETHPFHPDRTLAALVGPLPRIAYDRDNVRRRLEVAERHGTLRRWARPVDGVLGQVHERRDHVGQLLRLDPISQTWAEVDRGSLLYGILGRDPRRELHTGVAYRAETVRDMVDQACDLVVVHHATGGWPAGQAHQPDSSIELPVERAFEFAGRLIAAGVDHALAVAWAWGIAAAHGYELREPYLGVSPRDDCGNPRLDEGLRPPRTPLSEYYAAALEGLRECQDGHRFMDLMVRTYTRPKVRGR